MSNHAVIAITLDYTGTSLTTNEINALKAALDSEKTNYTVLNAGSWFSVYNDTQYVLSASATYHDPCSYSDGDLSQAYYDMLTASYNTLYPRPHWSAYLWINGEGYVDGDESAGGDD